MLEWKMNTNKVHLASLNIPIFSGIIQEFANWRAMVKVCLEETDGASYEKVIRLRQSLVGEPFKLIERLGFEGEIFVKALERLDERYGGQRRIYLALMSDIDKFRPIRLNERKDLESFARLLDEVVEKQDSIGKADELRNGFLYEKLLKKFPGKMLID